MLDPAQRLFQRRKNGAKMEKTGIIKGDILKQFGKSSASPKSFIYAVFVANKRLRKPH
jgi:hypothetical protein